MSLSLSLDFYLTPILELVTPIWALVFFTWDAGLTPIIFVLVLGLIVIGGGYGILFVASAIDGLSELILDPKLSNFTYYYVTTPDLVGEDSWMILLF